MTTSEYRNSDFARGRALLSGTRRFAAIVLAWTMVLSILAAAPTGAAAQTGSEDGQAEEPVDESDETDPDSESPEDGDSTEGGEDAEPTDDPGAVDPAAEEDVADPDAAPAVVDDAGVPAPELAPGDGPAGYTDPALLGLPNTPEEELTVISIEVPSDGQEAVEAGAESDSASQPGNGFGKTGDRFVADPGLVRVEIAARSDAASGRSSSPKGVNDKASAARDRKPAATDTPDADATNHPAQDAAEEDPNTESGEDGADGATDDGAADEAGDTGADTTDDGAADDGAADETGDTGADTTDDGAADDGGSDEVGDENVSQPVEDAGWEAEPGRLKLSAPLVELTFENESRVEVLVPGQQAKEGKLVGQERALEAKRAAGVDGKGRSGKAKGSEGLGNVRFDGLLDGINVEVQPIAGGTKLYYEVTSAEAAAQPIFEALRFDSSWSAKQDGDSIQLIDAADKPQVLWSGGPVWDAAGAESVATVELVKSVDGVAIARVVVDQAWMTSADRVFPIVVDPVTINYDCGPNRCQTISTSFASGISGSAPTETKPGYSHLNVASPFPKVGAEICFGYQVDKLTGGTWSAHDGGGTQWQLFSANCHEFGYLEQKVVTNVIVPSESDRAYTNGTYRVRWEAVYYDGRLNGWKGSPSTNPQSSFVVGPGPDPVGPSAAVPGANTVKLVADSGNWSAYQWSIQVHDRDGDASCNDRATVTSTVPSKTVSWPDTTAERFLWCVRGKTSGHTSMAYSAWSALVIERSNDARSRLFGVSPTAVMIDGVNAASGNWTFERTDAAMNGVATGLAVNRVYNSQDLDTEANSPFGIGWSSILDVRLARREIVSSNDSTQHDPPGSGGGSTTQSKYTTRFELVNADGSSESGWHVDETYITTSAGTNGPHWVTARQIDGITKQLTYDAGTWTMTARDGSQMVFDRQLRLTSIKAATGARLFFDRNPTGLVTAIRDGVTGRQINLTWKSYRQTNGAIHRRVDTATLPDANSATATVRWKYHYQDNGKQLVKVCDPRTTSTTEYCEKYKWNQAGLSIWRVFDESTPVTGTPKFEAVYDANRVSRMKLFPSAAGLITKFDYGSKPLFTANAVTEVTDPRNNVWRYTFDHNGQVTKKDAPDARGWTGQTTYTYEDGRRTQISAPSSSGDPKQRNVTTFAYDNKGNLKSMTDGAKHVTRYYYNGNNLVAECPHGAGTDQNSQKCTRHGYSGRLRTSTTRYVVQNARSVERWTHNGNGQVLTHTMPSGRATGDLVTRYEYYTSNSGLSKVGDLQRIRYPSGLVHRFQYDSWGNVIRIWESYPGKGEYLLESRYHNSQTGLLAQVEGPTVKNAVAGTSHRNRSRHFYRANKTRYATLVQDRLDSTQPTRQSNFYHDRLQREVESRGPTAPLDGGGTVRPTIKRTFDANGNVTRVCDPNNVCTTTAYDARNRPTTVKVGGITVQTVTYWDSDLENTRTDGEGHQEYYNYTRAERLSLVRERNKGGDWGLAEYRKYVVGTDWPLEISSGGKWNGAGGTYPSKTTIFYEPSGLPRTITEHDATGNRVTINRYFLDGQLKNETVSANGKQTVTAFGYDAGGYPAKITDDYGGLNLVTSSVNDPRGHVTSITDPRRKTTRFTVDEAGRTNRTVAHSVATWGGHSTNHSSQSATTTIGYDAFGNAVAVKDPAGFITTTTFDSVDRIKSIAQPRLTQIVGDTHNASEYFGYDPSGNLVVHVNRNGVITRNGYDDFNRVVQTRVGTSRTTKFKYDKVGNLIETIDPTGARTTARYNMWGLPTSETQHRRTFNYSNGLTETAKNLTTRYTYDDLANLKSITTPLGLRTSILNDSFGRPTVVTAPGNRKTRTNYDYAGRPIRVVNPVGQRVNHIYDGAGRLTQTATYGPGDNSPMTRTDYTHNESGNVVTEKSLEGVAKKYTWDSLNRLASSQITSVTPAIINRYGYDIRGNLAYFKDGEGRVTTYTSNAWNLREATREPVTAASPSVAGRVYQSAYDKSGAEILRVEPGNVRTTITRNEFNEIVREASGSAYRAMTYDKAGRMSSMKSNGLATATSFDYDDLGLMRESKGPAGSTLSDFDEDSRLIFRNDVGVGNHLFEWTNANDLKTHVDGVSGKKSTYQWFPDGRLDKVKMGSGIERRFGYHADGRLHSDDWYEGSARRSRRSYQYDRDNNVDYQAQYQYGVSSQSRRLRYDYDKADRLTKFTIELKDGAPWTGTPDTTVIYGYDRAGNRTSEKTNGSVKRWTYDERNRLLTGPGERYEWTPRGTLKRITRSGGTTALYEFDGLGQMTKVGAITYGYDGLGRLHKRTQNSRTKKFAYSGFGRDPVSDGTSEYGRGVDGVLTSVLGSNGVKRLAAVDRFGDLMHLSNTANGRPTETVTFDPFGGVIDQWGNDPDPALGFQSDWTDPTTGNVNMDARWYTPNSGTFRSRDSFSGVLDSPISLNRYTYGANNPIRYWDPSGRCNLSGADAHLCNHAPPPNPYAGADGGIVPGADLGGGYQPAPTPNPYAGADVGIVPGVDPTASMGNPYHGESIGGHGVDPFDDANAYQPGAVDDVTDVFVQHLDDAGTGYVGFVVQTCTINADCGSPLEVSEIRQNFPNRIISNPNSIMGHDTLVWFGPTTAALIANGLRPGEIEMTDAAEAFFATVAELADRQANAVGGRKVRLNQAIAEMMSTRSYAEMSPGARGVVDDLISVRTDHAVDVFTLREVGKAARALTVVADAVDLGFAINDGLNQTNGRGVTEEVIIGGFGIAGGAGAGALGAACGPGAIVCVPVFGFAGEQGAEWVMTDGLQSLVNGLYDMATCRKCIRGGG